MENMKEFVDVQLGANTINAPNAPVSFRCSEETVIKLNLLAKYLDFSTRSKLLAKLIPIAIKDAVANLPSQMAKSFYDEYDQQLHDFYEEHATRDL